MDKLREVDEKIKMVMIQEDLTDSKEEKKALGVLLGVLRTKRSRLAK